MPESSINHREFYRLRYPIIDRPKLEMNGQQFDVTEIAERSLQFAQADNLRFQIGTEISGTVTFNDGQTVNIFGRFGRIRRNEGVIVELEGVDLSRMFKEQSYLNAKFPRLKTLS
jgi:hypothetical protein